MNLKELLQNIELNPAMYLGQASITRLSGFLDGYIMGSGCDSFLPEFQEWVAQTYGISSSHKWSDIILFYEQDEISAFYHFFKLLHEFAHQEPRANQ